MYNYCEVKECNYTYYQCSVRGGVNTTYPLTGGYFYSGGVELVHIISFTFCLLTPQTPCNDIFGAYLAT